MRTVIPIAVQASRQNAKPAAANHSDQQSALHLTASPPLALYVHVPWCVRKCPYCDFNSHPVNLLPDVEFTGELPEEAYLHSLRADLEQALPEVWGRSVVSVFIGGGTPSLLSARAVDDLLTLLRTHLPLVPDAEITLEANPGAIEAGKFAAFAASGVNRISLGIQSFDDTALQRLGRIHTARQAQQAIELAQRSVARVNLDVMFGLPQQTLAQSRQDLRTAMSFGTEHLSLYNLTLEPNTVFAKFPPAGLPGDDLAAAMQEQAESLAAQGGWQRYEVSAYALSTAARSQHNLNYWQFGDYLGIGPGAHSKLTFHDRIVRCARVRQPQSWMAKAVLRNGSHVATRQNVSARELPFEFMMNALRLKAGVPAPWFSQRTGLPQQAVSAAVNRCIEKGLLMDTPLRWQATELGWRFLNDTLTEFL